MVATAQEQAYEMNRVHRKAWSLPFDSVDPTGADDYFCTVKNDGAKALVIHRICAESTVAGTVEVHEVTGTNAGGTTLAPASKTVRGGPAPDATVEYGVDITGLTKQGTLDFIALSVAGGDVIHNYDEGIRILTGQEVALLWDTATGVLTGAIHIYEEPDTV